MPTAIMNPVKQRCHLAWHITSRCNLACPHCLRRSPGQANRDLPREQCVHILQSFVAFARDSGREASIEFSGGNPLLRDDFPELLRLANAARQSGPVRHLRILGNPETLDQAMVALLREANVDEFVISLDGLESANDQMRGPGSFQAGMRGIRALVQAGIPTNIKYTLVRANAHQVVDVLRIAIAERVGQVGLGPLILAGGGYQQRDQALTPLEYRQVLLDALHFLDGVAGQHAAFRQSFLTSNRMYALLFEELGRGDEYRQLCTNGRARRQTGGGGVLFVVWSDGEVVLRREMQRQGWVPRDSFQQIYDGSYLMRMLEDRTFMAQAAKEAQQEFVRCRACPMAAQCPPALVGTFGAKPLFQPSEHCWR